MLPFSFESLTDGWQSLGPVKMPTQKAKKIPEAEWQAHKQVLEHLWLEEDRKLVAGEESVKKIMESRHYFFAS